MSTSNVTNAAPVARRASRVQARAARLRRLPLDPLGLVGIVLLVGGWWLLAQSLSPTQVPAPQDVLQRISDEATSSYQMQSFGLQREGFLGNLLYTATTVLIAVGVGSLVGILLGLFSARSPLFRAGLDPVVLVGGAVPVLVAAPFFLIWFGTERWVAYLIVGLYSALTLIVFAQRAADNLAPTYEQNARTLGASRGAILRTVLLPGILPELLGGVRIALAAGWGLAAIAELLGLPAGLGKVVEAYATTTDTQAIFAAILLLGIAAVIVDTIVVLALRRLFRWRAGTERSTL